MASFVGELSAETRSRSTTRFRIFDGDTESEASPLVTHPKVDDKKSDPLVLSRSELRWSKAAFLILGVGVAMCWTMLQSGISFFEAKYAMGSKFYLAMVAAYNIPVLPLLLAQAVLDRNYDVRFGAERTFLFRFVIGFGSLSAILCVVPFVNEFMCLFVVALVGVMDSVAFGSSAQLFSMFPAECGSYYFIGASTTSLLSIAITVGSGFANGTGTQTSAVITYAISGFVTLLGLLSTITLIRSGVGQRILMAKTAADLENHKSDSTINNKDESSLAGASSNSQLFGTTKYAHGALGLVWFVSTLCGSMVSYVPSQDKSDSLKLILVYAGMISSLLGKQLNALGKPLWVTSQQRLFASVVALSLFACFFIFYIAQSSINPTGTDYFTYDYLIIAHIAVFNFWGAFFSSMSYGMASELIESQTDKAQNSALLGLTLMVGVYLGLGGSFVLSYVLTAPVN